MTVRYQAKYIMITLLDIYLQETNEVINSHMAAPGRLEWTEL